MLAKIKQQLRKKQCPLCKVTHIALPENHKLLWEGDPMDGIYFQCFCETTIFIPRHKIDNDEKQAA